MKSSDRPIKSIIVWKPLLIFFVLSYAFFWLLLILFVVTLGVFHLKQDVLPTWLMPLITIAGSWTPALAAVIVTGTLEGRRGIRKLFRKFLQFRIPSRWYLATFIPLGLAIVSAGIYWLAGGVLSSGVNLSLSFWIGLTIINLLEGPTGEEVGWRGFALPRLLERYSAMKAGIVLGIIWGFWHLPLWLNSGFTGLNLLLYCLLFLIAITSLSVMMTWIFCRTVKSLIPMTISHFSFNASFMLIGSYIPTLSFFAIMAALLFLTVVILWISGGMTRV